MVSRPANLPLTIPGCHLRQRLFPAPIPNNVPLFELKNDRAGTLSAPGHHHFCGRAWHKYGEDHALRSARFRPVSQLVTEDLTRFRKRSKQSTFLDLGRSHPSIDSLLHPDRDGHRADASPLPTNHSSIWLSHDEKVGVKWEVYAAVVLEEFADQPGLVGRKASLAASARPRWCYEPHG